MDLVSAVILGIVEGVTEFLPVSSTGHLILVQRALGIGAGGFASSFAIAIQVGAILAVVSLYGRLLLRRPGLVLRLAAAFVPTAVIGAALYPFIKRLLDSPLVIVWALGLGGLALVVFEQAVAEPADAGEDLARMPYRHAVLIGIAQSVAMIPGVSRAAATVCGGLALGMSRRAIVEFSFLLALPTMAAAAGYDLIRSAPAFSGGEFGLLALGFIVSWATAVAAIRWLLRFIQTHDFTWFGVYRMLIALVFAWLVL
ncbi:MAG TPA: undecaprenyl-diphosphate phosphatase [Candidatus Paceibacterota bacterium]|nr:undecaprenyl-diphosphate phosphatase [Candidatus Paceibacterota bacterium]